MIAREGYGAALLDGLFFLAPRGRAGVIIETSGPFGENGSAWLSQQRRLPNENEIRRVRALLKCR